MSQMTSSSQKCDASRTAPGQFLDWNQIDQCPPLTDFSPWILKKMEINLISHAKQRN